MEKMEIDGKMVGEKEPAYIIAEMSGNHNGDIRQIGRAHV